MEMEDKKTQLTNTQTFKILDISALQASNGSEIQNALENQSTNHTNVQSIPTIQITKEQFPQLFNQTFQSPNPTASQSQSINSSTSSSSHKLNDEYDAIGLNVAVKLRSMNPHQRIIAEKLIGDVLFNGQLNTLSITSHLTQ
uniref:BESS domain-containing protein n=1 Tax=Megaselia scalaris TaxID=36166 RepID=T1GQH3_MEGSC